jgi:uncharacterized protein YggT (Ycf19 family)
MLIFLQIVHELVKFAGLLLLAQGLVYVLSFGRHETNPIYQFVRFLTSPVTRVVRKVTPRLVVDRHVPYAAFFLLFWVYVILIFVRLDFIKGAA